MIRARVFSKDGNRFLIPGYWCDEGDENWSGMSSTAILCDGMMLGIVCGFDAEQDWLDVPIGENGRAELTNIPYRLIGRQFTHGAIDILLVSGPLFDEATARESADAG